MTGVGGAELAFLFLLFLLLFGPKDLPRIARFTARLFYDMKNIFQKLEKEWRLPKNSPSAPKTKSSELKE